MTLQETQTRQSQVKPRLVVIGSDMRDVVFTGALLQPGFAAVSLIHTDQPLQRALQADRAAVTVLLAPPADADPAGLAHTLGLNASILVFLTGAAEASTLAGVARSRVFGPDDAVLLQATVASMTTQRLLSERA